LRRTLLILVIAPFSLETIPFTLRRNQLCFGHDWSGIPEKEADGAIEEDVLVWCYGRDRGRRDQDLPHLKE